MNGGLIHKNTGAMLFAAGLGTRLKPFTNNHPKALAVVNNKTLLQRNIEYLQGYGISNVIVNVHHFAQQIINTINDNNGWGSNIIISDETSEVLETGGGLKKAAPLLQGFQNIVVMNVDILTNLNLNAMLQQHLVTKSLATLAVTNRETSRYFVFNTQQQLCGWKNVQTEETRGIAVIDSSHQLLAFSGVQIIQQQMLSLIKQQGKFSLVEVYLDLMKDNSIKAFNHSPDKFIDVGKPESLLQAEKMFV